MKMFENWITRWLRADAALILASTLWAVNATHTRWPWFLALFLLPDLSILGYSFGKRIGAFTYNVGHLYAWPVAILVTGLTYHITLATTAALSWIAHIAFDQTVGYGLKLPAGFEHTSLGLIGRARADATSAGRPSR